jgi:hypothetical protein
VSAAPIVEDLDIIENISAGKISCFVDAFADTFFFQAAEEGFGYCVDAPMSRNLCGVCQISQNQRVELSNNVAFQATMNFLL